MADRLLADDQPGAPVRDISAEYSPMTALDEYLIHQTSFPVRVMNTTDPRAYERLWFTCQDRTGDLFVVMGLGFYMNLNTAEAFAIVNRRGRLANIHAHRRLGDNRMNMRVGPLNFNVVESFKDWHLTLGQNKFNIAYDLHWYDTKRAVFTNDSLRLSRRMSPIAADAICGYETFGAVEGWVTVEGERFAIDAKVHCGARDHHWGTREGVGGKGHMRSAGGDFSALPWAVPFVEFKDWSAFGERIFLNPGDARPGFESFAPGKRTLKLKFDRDTQQFAEGLITNFTATGEKRELHLRRLGNQTAYLRCGMYGEPGGGTPDGNIWHGVYVGDDVIGGGVYDTNDPGVRRMLSGLNEHHCEVSCGTETAIGIMEVTDQIVYERCRKGGRYQVWDEQGV